MHDMAAIRRMVSCNPVLFMYQERDNVHVLRFLKKGMRRKMTIELSRIATVV